MAKIRAGVVIELGDNCLMCSEKDGEYRYSLMKNDKHGGVAYVSPEDFLKCAEKIFQWHHDELDD
jgi:hypothetical protein